MSEVEKSAELVTFEEEPRPLTLEHPEVGVAPPSQDRQVLDESQEEEGRWKRHRDSASTLNHSSSVTEGTVSVERSLELHGVSWRSVGSQGPAGVASEQGVEKESRAMEQDKEEEENFHSLSLASPPSVSSGSMLTPPLPGLSSPPQDGEG